MSQGALQLAYELEQYLNEVTGMDAATLQPAAGAHGELTAMLLFHAYHKSKGEKRSKILIPDTAHGTNPASASLCGYESVGVKSNEDGILSVESLEAIMDEDTVGVMVTNPNTLGLFEENIKKVAEIVHGKGGLVYCDGANLNAVMGMVKMGKIGIDAIHLNLHKTFSTPHGGGGPGAGPVCVAEKLAPFLPVPRVVKDGDIFNLKYDYPESIGKIHAFYGNFGVLIRACSYILSMGKDLKTASQCAVLNANYIKERLKDVYTPALRPPLHARMRLHRQDSGGTRRRHPGHRQKAHRLRFPSPHGLFPPCGARRDHDRAHRHGVQGDHRPVRRGPCGPSPRKPRKTRNFSSRPRPSPRWAAWTKWRRPGSRACGDDAIHENGKRE